MPYHMPYYGVGWGILMLLGMLIFWGLVIAGLVLLIRYLAAQTPAPRPVTGSTMAETPVDILNRRLANGEITMDEYENLRNRIDEGNRSA